MSINVERQDPEHFPLAPLVEVLRGRSEAIARLQGGPAHFTEELAIFREEASGKSLFLSRAPAELDRPPSDEGNEHQVWYREPSATFLKATWPGFFGVKVIQRIDEDERASPIDYLERWQFHNQLFGDDVRFLGALDTDRGIRLLISQPAIAGEPATVEQIRTFFTSNGWRAFEAGGELAFYDPVHEIAISDTHRGNIVLMSDGLLAPIDLRVQRLSGSLLDAVLRLCGI
ncbi:MAG: hypothetical protein R3F19_11955 [Verrucomicrobiales bacterium]